MNGLKIVKDNYKDYAQYLIKTRSIPSVNDGFKHVQRRNIYTAHKIGLGDFKKSTKLVGATMAIHPHGESYSTVVNMVNSLFPVFEGWGNFGSRFGDAASAARYTELRLDKFWSKLYLDYIDYTPLVESESDPTEKEPEFLPALISYSFSGQEGISIGFNSYIPAMNVEDIIHRYINHLDPSHRKVTPLPDEMDWTVLTKASDVEKIYEAGEGVIAVRGKYKVEGNSVVIESLPAKTCLNKIKKKLVKYTDKDYVVERDETKGSLRIVFEILDESQIKVKALEDIVAEGLLSNLNVRMILSDETGDKACLYSLDQIIDAGLVYLKKIVNIHYNTLYDKTKKKLRIIEAIEYLIKNNIKLSNYSSEDLKNVVLKDFQDVTDDLLKRSVRSITKDYEKEKQELTDNFKRYEEILKDVDAYLLNRYHELLKAPQVKKSRKAKWA